MKRFTFSILAAILLCASGFSAVNAAQTIRVQNETGALIAVTVRYGGQTRKADVSPRNGYNFPFTYSNKQAESIRVEGRAMNVPRKRQWVCGVSGPRADTYTVTVSGGRCSIR